MNNAQGCFNLGIEYGNGKGIEHDYRKAKYYYEKACNLGMGEGCNSLGFFYGKGMGVNQNISTAKKYFEKACNLDNQKGCHNYKLLNKQGY